MKRLLFAINVDWYFDLHWRERLVSSMTEGYDVRICLGRSREDFSCPNCSVSFLNYSRSGVGLLDNFRALLASYRLIGESGPDLIHSVTVKPNLFFGLSALVRRCPIVVTIPGLGSVFSGSGMRFALLQRFLLFCYGLVGKNKRAFFVFENREDAALFQEKQICSIINSRVVPGAGVNVDSFSCSPDPSSEEGPVVLLFAARLLKGKGLEDLIAAVQQIREQGRDVRIDVAGIVDDDSVEVIPESQMRRWDQKGDINWLGYVDDMPALLAQVHMVVLPTRYAEGLPRILLEAAACGRPVIATDVPGCRDFIENGVNGLLVPPGDIESLARAVVRLLDKETRTALGQAGRRRVESHYTVEKVVDQYKDIYLHCTG